jgi:hypothetical protein
MRTKAQLWEQIDTDAFISAYVEAIIFTEEDRLNEDLGRDWQSDQFSIRALRKIVNDCLAFIASAEQAGIQVITASYNWGCAGHDFWFTRNQHGVGFWDRNHPSGDALTRLSDKFGEVCCYGSDTGKIELA